MNRIAIVVGVLAVSAFVHAQVSNVVDQNFVGMVGESGLSLSDIDEFSSANSSFSGGGAIDGGQSSSGMGGLMLQSISVMTVSNDLSSAARIRGGDGGLAAIMVEGAGSLGRGDANGGYGISVDANSNPAFDGPNGGVLEIINGSVEGGNAGEITAMSGNIAVANGGSALFLEDISFTLRDGSFEGGDGGNMSADDVSEAKFSGGDGIRAGQDSFVLSLEGNLRAIGGDGGSFISLQGAGDGEAKGGSGAFLSGFFPSGLNLESGYFVGGSGGDVIGQEGIDVSGGIGLYMNFQDATISGGEFYGGAGGDAIVTNSEATANADGGVGLYAFQNSSLDISGGTFRGGDAGTVNGVMARQGAALQLASSRASISGGSFEGYGLLMTNVTTDGFLEILGDNVQMGDMQITSSEGVSFDFSQGVLVTNSRANVLNIDGSSSFGEVRFNGSSTNIVSMNGGQYEGVIFAGAGYNLAELSNIITPSLFFADNADNRVSVSNSAITRVGFSGLTSNDVILVNSGVTEVQYSASTTNVLRLISNNAVIDSLEQTSGRLELVAEGEIRANSIDLMAGDLLIEGADLVLEENGDSLIGDASSSFTVAQTLRVQRGGVLNVGLGSLNVSNLIVDSGAELNTLYWDEDFEDDVDPVHGTIMVEDRATLSNGVLWAIKGGDGDTPTNGQEIVLLESESGNIDLDMTLDTVFFEGDQRPWMEGITNVVVNGSRIVAVYDRFSLDHVLLQYAGIDESSVLGQVARDISEFSNSDAVQVLEELGTLENALVRLEDEFLYAPEMASTLMGAQGAFVGQVNQRAQSFRVLNRATVQSPMGAGGPEAYWYDDAKQWMEDNLPFSQDPAKDVRAGAKRKTKGLPEVPAKSDLVVQNKPYISAGASKQNANSYDNFRTWLRNLFPKPSGEPKDMPKSYQVWGRGFVSGVDQNSTDGHKGYDGIVGGAVVGVDRRFEKLLLGLGAGYSHSTVRGVNDQDADADTGHVVLYAAVDGDIGYLDANINYARSDVETEGYEAFGYEGDYGANAYTFYFGGGLDFDLKGGAFRLTPEASFMSTYYSRDGYTKTSSSGFDAQIWDSYDEWSHLSSLGATLSMVRHIENFKLGMEFQPEVRVHWLHEFNPDLEGTSFRFANGGTYDVSLQAREEDLLKVGGGLRFSKWQSDDFEFALDADAVIGADYTAYTLGGKVMRRF